MNSIRSNLPLKILPQCSASLIFDFNQFKLLHMKKLTLTTATFILFFSITGLAQVGDPCEVCVPSPQTPLTQEQIDQLKANPNVYEPFVEESNLVKPAGFGTGSGSRSAFDSQGTDFWLMFLSNAIQESLYLDITSGVNASGTVSIPGLAFSTPFNVSANTVTRVNLPISAMVTNTGTVQSKGIHVVSDFEVSVYGMNRAGFTTDGFLGLPVDILGTDYLVMTYSNSYQSEFGIVSPTDNNTVTITPKSATANGNPAGVPFNVVLNQGQTYMVGSSGDQTGAIVSASSPVAVFSGELCANVPNGYCCCDHICEQLPPVSSWGETFVTKPLASRTNGDFWRFLASENGTQLFINGVLVANLNFGGYYETNLNASSFVSANNPILAVQFSASSDWDGVLSDPFMMIVPPYQQFFSSYVFSTPQSGFVTNYFNSSVQTPGIPGMQLNGGPLNPASYSAIGATGYSSAAFPVGINTSYLLNNTSGFPSGLNLYGFNEYDSYGYPGGQAFGAIATATTLTIAPVNGSAAVGNNQCWEAELLDQFGDPVAGVRVDFNVTGAHNGYTGFAFTDGNGHATYCFAGVNPGNDIIIANVGQLNATAQFNWTGGGTAVPVSNWALYLGVLLAVGFVIVRFRKMI